MRRRQQAAMPCGVTVATGARLHFGLIVAPGDAGPKFAGVGAMIAEPGFSLQMELLHAAEASGSDDELLAPEAVARRLAEFLQSCRGRQPSRWVRIEVCRTIPEHVGLGSGTQLALAVAAAWKQLTGCETPPERLGRGRRSQIGLHGFQHGGMLAYGVANDDAQVQQHPLPDSWRFVLVTPPGRVGLSGAAEQSTFQSARPLASAEAASLLRLVRNDWWPAVVRADFDAFSSALEEFGRRVGEYFAPQQGGVFADPMMATLAQQLGAAGVAGVAQTSWGPTIAIACRDADHAQELEHQIRADERWASCAVHITAALNRGATVRVW